MTTFGPQPPPHDQRIFNRPGNSRQISEFFEEGARHTMTTYTGPTPYSAEIERQEKIRQEKIKAGILGPFSSAGYLTWLWGGREGYRRAKTEDAPLLEAARRVDAAVDEADQTASLLAYDKELYQAVNALHDAITVATKGG